MKAVIPVEKYGLRGGGTVFGHKSSSKTTVGTATVQSPSMLDNVSSQDFSAADPPNDIQQQVQDALTQHEMKKMEIVEPAVSGGFMSSPSATAVQSDASSSASASTTPPTDPPPVSAQVPFNVASIEAPSTPPPSDNADNSIPRPLTPEEDKEAEKEAENMPAISIVSTSTTAEPAPSSAPSDIASSSGTDNASNSSNISESNAVSASDTNAEAVAESPSAPIDPPPVPDMPLADSVAVNEETIDQIPEVKVSASEPVTSVSAAASELPSVAPVEAAKTPPQTPDVVAEEPALGSSSASEAETETEAEANSAVEPEASTETAESTDSNVDAEAYKEETEAATPKEPTTSDMDGASSSIVASGIPAVDTNKLAALKQHALNHLEPLADQLDQSPEEEFRTTMMRIQANDNHTLLEKALDAAKRIEDGTARAKALLDIINEINYFAQVADDQDQMPLVQ